MNLYQLGFSFCILHSTELQCWPNKMHLYFTASLPHSVQSTVSLQPTWLYVQLRLPHLPHLRRSVLVPSVLAIWWSLIASFVNFFRNSFRSSFAISCNKNNAISPSGPRFNIKAIRYGDPHYKDKTVMKLSYLNGDVNTGNTMSLYWNRP